MRLFFWTMKKRIAIQGYAGSYHHEAANKFFGNDCELQMCDTFSTLAKAVANEEVDAAIMAIENTIAGSILPNYGLITQYQLKVVGEIFLSIQHQLMVKKGQKLSDIQEVRSHQMALLQCMNYLDQHPDWKIVNDLDTALIAQKIAENNLENVAAIASKKAAEVYDLDIVASTIQTYPDNFTRFFVLEKKHCELKEFNKASLRFSTTHETGALAGVLNEAASLGINLEKLQSIPIIHKPWKYSFHADLTFPDKERYYLLLGKIAKKLTDLEILGEYKQGIK